MQSLNDPNAPLLLFEHPTRSGHRIAEARLNSESTLNSLSLPMIELFEPALARWRDDPDVVGLLVTGAGDRAFCAGGDIQALYRAIRANQQAGEIVDRYPFEFFEREYRLDFHLHTFPKPLITLGHGICMGGGLGIFAASRYRIVTGTSRFALPEVTIGLFPDAGGTWLLAHLPPHLAAFAALTGSHLNAADAMAAGLGTHQVAADQRSQVLARLLDADWSASGADDAVVRDVLEALPRPELPAAETGAVPVSLDARGSIQQAAARVRELAGQSRWIDKGIATLDRGCPTSVGIVVRQLQRAPQLTLADSFRLEMIIATHCAMHPDFPEGVRALLIDKDNQPQWRYPDLDALPDAYVEEHFTPPWEHNPLQDLREDLKEDLKE